MTGNTTTTPLGEKDERVRITIVMLSNPATIQPSGQELSIVISAIILIVQGFISEDSKLMHLEGMDLFRR